MSILDLACISTKIVDLTRILNADQTRIFNKKMKYIQQLTAIFIICTLCNFSFALAEDDPFIKKRQQMVDKQIVSRGIKDPLVLDAMRRVPRHRFVPEKMQAMAYFDHPLPIGKKQTISQPYIVALMTESIKAKKTDRVLEIGTGSGYQAAILAEIAREVYTIEIVHSLFLEATEKLKLLGYTNVFTKYGDGYRGWPDFAPFDAIIVTAAPPKIPQPLVEQLAEGGRMIIPVADSYPQRLILLEKKNGEVSEKEILAVMFVPMTGEAQKSSSF